jgi:hypothetical protein
VEEEGRRGKAGQCGSDRGDPQGSTWEDRTIRPGGDPGTPQNHAAVTRNEGKIGISDGGLGTPPLSLAFWCQK